MKHIEECLENEKDAETEEAAEMAEIDDNDVESEARFDKIFLKTCMDHVHHFISMSGDF